MADTRIKVSNAANAITQVKAGQLSSISLTVGKLPYRPVDQGRGKQAAIAGNDGTKKVRDSVAYFLVGFSPDDLRDTVA